MPKSVMVVEDDEAVREVIQTCMDFGGYEVTALPDGRSALAALDRVRPDLILLDVRMPDITGWDLLGLLRHSPKYQSLPVIMLTGMSDPASQAYAWQLGCTCYLTKPIDLHDLLLLVERLLADPGAASDRMEKVSAEAPLPTAVSPLRACG
jgi:CheY-like chemotaxis protein